MHEIRNVGIKREDKKGRYDLENPRVHRNTAMCSNREEHFIPRQKRKSQAEMSRAAPV